MTKTTALDIWSFRLILDQEKRESIPTSWILSKEQKPHQWKHKKIKSNNFQRTETILITPTQALTDGIIIG